MDAYQRGFYVVPTVGRKGLKPTRFADGLEKGVCFADGANVERFQQLCESAAREVAGVEGCPVLLLGNEYSYVGRNRAGVWTYLGFDEVTQQAFRQWLWRRFGSVELLNRACGTQYGTFEQFKAPGRGRARYQWWLFLRETFSKYMKAGYEAAKRAAPRLNISYAKLMGSHWDPCTEDARLSFLDVQGDNLYWHWHKDWAWYCAMLSDLVANAPDKPCLITESGFQSLVLGEERAARLMRQMLANLLMHPQVAGVCVYAYCDEWYMDGDPAHQSPAESWGIVTAWRQPKKSYEAVAEVYKLIEQRLEPYLLAARDAPAVWVSAQELDGLLGGHKTSRRIEVIRALYSLGIPFRSIKGEELCHVDKVAPPRLILCDDVLFNDLSAIGGLGAGLDAGRAIERYIKAGGQVLYIAERPFEALYGQLDISPELKRVVERANPRATASIGRGRITVLRLASPTHVQAREAVREFMSSYLSSRPISLVRIEPADAGEELFWRVWNFEQGALVWVVNEGARALDVTLRVPSGATLVGSDGAQALVTPGQVHLRGLNTYAVLWCRLGKGASAKER